MRGYGLIEVWAKEGFNCIYIAVLLVTRDSLGILISPEVSARVSTDSSMSVERRAKKSREL
jgi:hypothetical protein